MLKTEKIEVYLVGGKDWKFDKYSGWSYKFIVDGDVISASTQSIDLTKEIADQGGEPLAGSAVFSFKRSDQGTYKIHLEEFKER